MKRTYELVFGRGSEGPIRKAGKTYLKTMQSNNDTPPRRVDEIQHASEGVSSELFSESTGGEQIGLEKRPVSPVKPDASRSGSHIFADEEDPDEAGGGVRITPSEHSSEQRADAHLDSELSRKLEDFVQAERRLELESRRGAAHQEILSAFREDALRRYRLLDVKYTALETKPGKEAEMERYAQKALAINTKLERASRLKQDATLNITQAKVALRKTQLDLAALLEDALVEILPPRSTPGPDSELAKEFAVPDGSSASDDGESINDKEAENKAYRRRSLSPGKVAVTRRARTVLSEVDRFKDWRPPRPSSTHSRSSSAMDRSWELRGKYAMAGQKLRNAQAEFDKQAARRDREADIFRQKLADGDSPSETAVEFDLRHLLEARQLTRRLIEAEEKLAEVKVKAVEGKERFVAWSGQSSGFVSRREDGLCSGEAPAAVGRVHNPTIEKWLEGISDTDLPGYARVRVARPYEGEWTEGRSVDICDSASLVADGKEKTRIDKWRDQCEAQWPECEALKSAEVSEAGTPRKKPRRSGRVARRGDRNITSPSEQLR